MPGFSIIDLAFLERTEPTSKCRSLKRLLIYDIELSFRGDWCIHPLALSTESCTCLPLFGSNSANRRSSDLQFCWNSFLLLDELCGFTYASPVSDCVFSISFIRCMNSCRHVQPFMRTVSDSECAVSSGTVELCYCGQNRELGALFRFNSWSPVDIGPVVTVKVSVCCKCSAVSLLLFWMLNCDSSTQCNVTALFS